MDKYIYFDPQLTKHDRLLLENLAEDIKLQSGENGVSNGGSKGSKQGSAACDDDRNNEILATLDALNNPKDSHFEPSLFNNVDYDQIQWKKWFNRFILRPYIPIAKSIVRFDTDVVMLTHLLLYFTTSVPSALFLYFGKFTWIHGILHMVMQGSYIGTYTLMMHQHIHQRGVLKKKFAAFDLLFPYITDPLMGHSWNSYYYHHVKHHHVEGNGPNDLSSTVRYQRDDIWHFLHYVGRFYFFVWAELPMYFIREKRYVFAAKSMFWDVGYYTTVYVLFKINPLPTTCVLLLPLLILRVALMIGNWGQHAFVDDTEPTSDYRSSITLIDVVSNRHSFNDGYHTSHHLNPMRHWREHPNHFMKSKKVYASHNALVFHNIDYFMVTIRLLCKDYEHLAKCLVPIGEEQIAMNLSERVAMLKRHTRRFTEEEIKVKFHLS
ncbi:uncharacterized protein BCR38DRAFT_459523 [Pseudomassariella vexata]|uniref:Fatty acid desaturase domain-containing protein n=1 Tax=Pseudomassariella vexata TaxID=1141098 RepID=A0A1Y2DR12_9PEZI|nr:uncharacterized protein BCR38DRAFT_459523 [Pseudomassariella vexata]ORY61733.1 hypothetical protein BCR38DRAFT_459523 [Pseudomassariella vexata]